MPNKEIGKCPKCDAMLTDNDIECEMLFLKLKGSRHEVRVHYHICQKCNYIIGVSN